MKLIIMLFSLIDFLVYNLISWMVRLIVILAYSDFFTDDIINDFKNKVFIVLSVVMLFKIVISCIQYIAMPDAFDDKEKGMGGILKRSAICIILLLAVDPALNFAMKIQTSIISTIPRLILGTNAADDDPGDTGETVAWATLSSFIKNSDGSQLSQNCPFGDHCDAPLEGFLDHAVDGCSLILAEDCKYDYTFIISTVCGGFVVYSLLGILLDVGIRVIKLGLIRLLYPIPVANYINKKDSLKTFFNTTISVYTDLFIRIGILYFVIYFIEIIIKSLGSSDEIYRNVPFHVNGVEKPFIQVILIIALFMFASKAPDFICGLLGIEKKGEGFKDMFKPAWSRAGGAVGQMINPLRNGVSNFRSAWKNNGDMGSKGKRIRNALKHSAGGLAKGTVDAFAGMMAGEDWAKMNERHKRSVAKSTARSVGAKSKRNMEKEAEALGMTIEDYKKQLEKAKAIRLQLEAERNNNREQAYVNHIRELQSTINRLNNMDNMTAEDQNDLLKATQELTELQSAAGKEAWMNNKADQEIAKRNVIAQNKENFDGKWNELQQVETDLKTIDQKIGDAESSMKQTENVLGQTKAKIASLEGNPNLTDEQLTELSTLKQIETTYQEKYDKQSTECADLKKQKEEKNVKVENISRELKDMADYDEHTKEVTRYKASETAIENELKRMNNEYDSKIKEQTDVIEMIEGRTNEFGQHVNGMLNVYEDKQSELVKSSKSTEHIKVVAQNAYDVFLGGDGYSGKKYIDFSTTLKNDRSSILIGEAIPKMDRDSNQFAQEDGNPFTITIGGKNIVYADIKDMGNRAKSDLLSETEFAALKRDKGLDERLTLSEFRQAFEKEQKNAGGQYILANLAREGLLSDAARPHLRIKLNPGAKVNETIIEQYKTIENDILNSGLQPDDLARELKAFYDNPADYMIGAADLSEKLKNKGRRLQASEPPKGDK